MYRFQIRKLLSGPKHGSLLHDKAMLRENAQECSRRTTMLQRSSGEWRM